MSVLQVRDLTIEFETPRGAFRAVDGVSFGLAPGERLGLIGESGSGKSTIALALMGLIRPPGRVVRGEAWLDPGAGGAVDLLAADDERLRAVRLARVALVTQGAMNSLNPVMRVRPQMVDAMHAHGVRLDQAGWRRRVADLLAAVNLTPEVADLYPHQLSGGMKQRVCIAIAISLQPAVIVADEPTSALDVVVQRRVMLALRRVQRHIGAAVILIGHDMGLMAQFAERVAVMKDGRLVEVGDVRQVFRAPRHPYTRDLMANLPTLDPAGRAAMLAAADTPAAEAPAEPAETPAAPAGGAPAPPAGGAPAGAEAPAAAAAEAG